MSIWVIIFCLLILTIISLKRSLENFWIKRGFPSANFEFPFGSLKGIGTEKSLCSGLDEFYKEFKSKGPAVGLFSFTKPFLLITDPELIRHVLVTNFDIFPDRTIYYNKTDDPISAHLLALQGKEWKDRRAMITPTFTSGKMKIMFEIIEYVSQQFVDTIKKALETSDSSNLEMYELVSCFTTDSISNVAFGLDSNSLNNPKSSMRKYGKEIINFGTLGFLKLIFTSSFPNFSRKIHLTANKRCVIDFFYNTFKANIEQREEKEIYRKDFLQILLELKKKQCLSIPDLAAESFIFFLGGFETSSGLMTFALYELARNKDIQDRLRNEILNAVKENNGKLTYDIIFDLKYLDMVINETLRKYPPAFIIFRRSKEDFKIPDSNLIIPKNTDININIFSLQNDPEYFPDPHKFNPERFSSKNLPKITPFTFIPFGQGQRSCVGRRFGVMQSKIGIAKLIANFEFDVCDKTSIPLEFTKPTFFLAPSNLMWLNVKNIKN